MTDSTNIGGIFYGVWQPGKGWLKAERVSANNIVQQIPFATTEKNIALELARRIGDGARVSYIDDSISAMEGTLIRAEYQANERRAWRRLWLWISGKRRIQT